MNVRFNAAAETELFEAAIHYSGRQAGLGFRFVPDVSAALTIITEAPFRWPELAEGVRRYRLSRFPFGICYRTLSSEIEIVAIADLRRYPNYWQDRLGS